MPRGLSKCFHRTIGIKQGCPLSATLFETYIDKITDFIVYKGGGVVELWGTQVHILLYTDYILLLFESKNGL